MDKFLLALHKLVNFLEGKKAAILAINGAFVSFLAARGVVAPDTAALEQSIVAILTGGALTVGSTQSYKDNKLGGKL